MWSINQIVDVKCLDSDQSIANAIQVELLLCPGRLVGNTFNNECSKHTLYNTIPYCYQKEILLWHKHVGNFAIKISGNYISSRTYTLE